MNATCPSGGSFTFRSILHGRDLLREGLIWRIGDGSSINVHHDNWIPRQGSLKPLGQDYMHGVTKGAHLLNTQGDGWDETKVDAMFLADDAGDIKQIVVGGQGRRDYQAWNFTKNGQFTVKSAYHLRMRINGMRTGRPGSSSPISKHKIWLALWDTNAPNKAKIHIWRLIRNGLAVGAELHLRRIKRGVFCVVCGREESTYHRFWSCTHGKMFWHKLRDEMEAPVVLPPEMDGSFSAISAWLLEWLAEATDAERETMIQALYGLWLARNEARDGKRIRDAGDVASSVSYHIKEWNEVHKRTPREASQRQVERWKPPELGWIKANADGANSKAQAKGGVGVVLRDQHGAYRGGASVFLPGITDPELLEVLASRHAVQLAIQQGAQKVHIELDSKEVVAMLNDEGMNHSAVGPLVEEVKELLRTRQEYKVSWARRAANEAAHRLAKEGISMGMNKVWLDVPPDCILQVVADMLSTHQPT